MPDRPLPERYPHSSGLPWLLLARSVASGCGSGFSPVAPGTAGSVAAFIPGLLLARTGALLPSLLAMIALGLWSVSYSLRYDAASLEYKTGSLGYDPGTIPGGTHGAQDPQWIVVDEWIGLWIALLGSAGSVWTGVIALVLFRIFDVWKPGPVGWAEKLPGAWGILADDIVAGVLGLVTCEVLLQVVV